MSDKFPWMAAEVGTYSTSAPDPHIDLSGSAVNFGTTFPSRTFAAAAADTDVDFDDTDTCMVIVVDLNDKTTWAVYSGVPWNDAATDTLDLSSGTLLASNNTFSNSDSVNVWALAPLGRYLPDGEGEDEGDLVHVNASGEWIVS